MKRYYILLAVLLPLVPLMAKAEGPGWTSSSKVKKIVVISNGGINIKLDPELSGCTSLSGYGSKYASVYPDHPGLEKIYSGLLAAYLSQTSVSVYLSDNTCKVGEVLFGEGL